ECPGRIVEDDGQMGRPVAIGAAARIAEQLPQHVAETSQCANRQAVRLARQRRQRMVGTEDVAGAVDEIEVVATLHAAWVARPWPPCPCLGPFTDILPSCNVVTIEMPQCQRQMRGIGSHEPHDPRIQACPQPPWIRTVAFPPLRAAVSLTEAAVVPLRHGGSSFSGKAYPAWRSCNSVLELFRPPEGFHWRGN